MMGAELKTFLLLSTLLNGRQPTTTKDRKFTVCATKHSATNCAGQIPRKAVIPVPFPARIPFRPVPHKYFHTGIYEPSRQSPIEQSSLNSPSESNKPTSSLALLMAYYSPVDPSGSLGSLLVPPRVTLSIGIRKPRSAI